MAQHDRLQAVHGGHRGVTTKLIKEADELLTVSPLTVKGRSCLDVINKQLHLKVELLSGDCIAMRGERYRGGHRRSRGYNG